MQRIYRSFVSSARILRRNPLFATASLITLVLAIGGNVALFSVFDAAFLRPLPYPDGGRLYRIDFENQQGLGNPALSGPMASFCLENGHSLGKAAIFESAAGTALSGEGSWRYVRKMNVSPSFFSVLQVQPQIGYIPNDESVGSAVVLSSSLWRSHFGSNPAITGKTIDIGGAPHTIVAVMPEHFAVFPDEPDVWVFSRLDPRSPEYPGDNFQILLRLSSALTPSQGQTQLERVTTLYDKIHPLPSIFKQHHLTFHLTSYQKALVGDYSNLLRFLLLAGVLILVVACANLALLLSARSAERRREYAIKRALGARTTALLVDALAESAIICFVGGVVGLVVATTLLPYLTSHLPDALSYLGTANINLDVVLFMIGITSLVALSFAIIPAMVGGVADSGVRLRSEGTALVLSHGRMRAMRAVLVVQVGISIFILLATAATVRSFIAFSHATSSIDASGVLACEISLADPKYQDPENIRKLITRVDSAQASVDQEPVAFSSILPGRLGFNVSVSNPSIVSRGVPATSEYRIVSPSYFAALSLEPMLGRVLRDSDAQEAPAVGVVNSAFVRQYLAVSAEGPIGQFVKAGKRQIQIVGVIHDTPDGSVGQVSAPTIIVPLAQADRNYLGQSIRLFPAGVLVRTMHNSGLEAARLKEALSRGIADFPLIRVTPVVDMLYRAIDEPRTYSGLGMLMTGFSILLLGIGLNGVVSYVIAGRRKEIGLRVALGAGRVKIVRLITQQILAAAAQGTLGGVLLAVLALRSLRAYFYGFNVVSPGVLSASVALVCLAIGVAAAYPVYTALRIPPADVLRAE